MSPKLLLKEILKTFLFSVLLFWGSAQVAYGQSLSPGDIAFTGFTSNSDGDFSIVALKDLPSNSEIHFTNQGWSGNGFKEVGDTFSWNTGSATISAGTVITFNNINLSNKSVSVGEVTATDIDLGDSTVLFAYLGEEDSPTTFLGSIATNVDLYNGSDGTLSNTGLVQDSTAILLTNNIRSAAFIGDRSGNTAKGYLAALNDINNWEVAASDATAVLPFDTQSFAMVSPPTISFSSDKAVGREGNTVTLTVELLESTGTAFDVDIAYLSEASTTTISDLKNYSGIEVSFGSGATDGATQSVAIDLADDRDFEGNEKAVFELKNNTSGTIITPTTFELTIVDNDFPNLKINEVLTDPPTGNSEDANSDGIRDHSIDEFIEIVNNEAGKIDISGWQVSNDGGTTTEYVFPEGTVLPAGGAIVVFGGGDLSGQFGSALVHVASSLNLANSSGQVTLLDQSGTVVDDFTYGSEAANGQSLTREGNGSGSPIKKHSRVEGSNGAIFSPGTKVDGSSFGSGHSIAFRGSEGWRLISSPVQGATFEDLIGNLWVQGFNGSDNPSSSGSVFFWTEKTGGTFTAPSGMSSTLQAGRGYMVYVFEDENLDKSGVQGEFPKVISSENDENSGNVSVPVTAHDVNGQNGIDGNEGWNLLGNPFGISISVDALFTALEKAGTVNTNIYIWDNDKKGGANYVELSKGDGERIAPYQAFWVRYTQSNIDTDVYFNKENLITHNNKEIYKNRDDDSFQLALKLHGGQKFDSYQLDFNQRGAIDLDRFDGYHLFSLDPRSIDFYSTLSNNRLQKNVLPANLNTTVEIPLYYEAGSREKLTMRWGDLKNAPKQWEFILIDKTNNREIDLRLADEYEFTNYKKESVQNEGQTEKLLNKAKDKSNSDSRFILSVRPNSDGLSSDQIPNSAKLNPNYPNPFNPTTTISYELAKDMEVKLTVWNMIGQKVATLVDGPAEAGQNSVTWNASNMPSGIYIARFEVGEKVYTRKMTLIK